MLRSLGRWKRIPQATERLQGIGSNITITATLFQLTPQLPGRRFCKLRCYRGPAQLPEPPFISVTTGIHSASKDFKENGQTIDFNLMNWKLYRDGWVLRLLFCLCWFCRFALRLWLGVCEVRKIAGWRVSIKNRE